MKYLQLLRAVIKRECKILYVNPIYFYSMVVFPLLAMVFFTTLLDDGVPQEMPVGVVDLDNTTMTRALGRKLDGLRLPLSAERYDGRAACQQAPHHLVLLQSDHVVGWFDGDEGPEDHSHAWCDGCRTGYDACEGTDRQTDSDTVAADPYRPPSDCESLEQL